MKIRRNCLDDCSMQKENKKTKLKRQQKWKRRKMYGWGWRVTIPQSSRPVRSVKTNCEITALTNEHLILKSARLNRSRKSAAFPLKQTEPHADLTLALPHPWLCLTLVNSTRPDPVSGSSSQAHVLTSKEVPDTLGWRMASVFRHLAAEVGFTSRLRLSTLMSTDRSLHRCEVFCSHCQHRENRYSQ